MKKLISKTNLEEINKLKSTPSFDEENLRQILSGNLLKNSQDLQTKSAKKDDKSDLGKRQSRILTSYNTCDSQNYFLPKQPSANTYQRASVIQSPVFRQTKEFERRDIIEYNHEVKKLQGNILHQTGKKIVKGA